MQGLEKGYNLGESFKQLLKGLEPGRYRHGIGRHALQHHGAGLIVMNAAKAGKLTDPQAVSWLLALYGLRRPGYDVHVPALPHPGRHRL